MSITTLSNMVHDTGGSSSLTQKNYFGKNVGAGFKVTKLQAAGAICFDESTGLTGFEDYAVVGWQFGATGYTPLAIGSAADFDGHNWLYGAVVQPQSAGIAVWSPNTATNGVVDRYAFDITVFAQFTVPSGGLDFWFSLGPTFPITGGGFRLFASLRLWYAG